MKIILASGSPRRRKLMEEAGITFEVIVSDADETITGEPQNQVEALAIRKAKAVRPQVDGEAIIVAADTLVAVNGQVLGKPVDAQEAFEMLNMLQSHGHTVFTGVALIKTGKESDTIHSFVESTDVFFRPLTDDEIHAYIATGEPFDKAGAYGVQERGAVLVDRVEGDFYTVVGLPISKVCTALNRMGYNT